MHAKSGPSLRKELHSPTIVQFVSSNMSLLTKLLVLLVLLSTIILDVEGAKKKKKKKKKEPAAVFVEPEVKNLWSEGGFVYDDKDRITDPVDMESDLRKWYEDPLRSNIPSLRENSKVYSNPSDYTSPASPGQIYGHAMWAATDLGYSVATENVAYAITVFVGYYDTKNATQIPPALSHNCNIGLCLFRFDCSCGMGSHLASFEEVLDTTSTVLGSIQDTFIASAGNIINAGADLGKILCKDMEVQHLTLKDGIAELERHVAPFKANPAAFDAVKTERALADINESASAQIMLRVLEKMCKIKFPAGKPETW
eukprot:sb/3467068/